MVELGKYNILASLILKIRLNPQPFSLLAVVNFFCSDFFFGGGRGGQLDC